MSNRIHPSLLTPEIMLRAYSAGLFPMAETADDPHLFWVDPEFRGIFLPDRIKVSKSLAKVVRSERFEIRIDHDFSAILDGCAGQGIDRPQTWINQAIRHLFTKLFETGHVHTVEVWQNSELVGGLYGLAIGGAFFGESMFHRRTDASKVALIHLAARLHAGGFRLLDTQFLTPHLASLGAIEVPRPHYKALLAQALVLKADFYALTKDHFVSGATALEIINHSG